MTFKSTIDKLYETGRLVSYLPRLRWDQSPGGYVHLCPTCAMKIEDIPNEVPGEDPHPLPKEQLKAVLDRICLGHGLLLGYDVVDRGKGLSLLKTRSVRMSGLFLSKDIFVGIDVKLRRHLNREHGATVTAAQWYRTSHSHALFQALSAHAKLSKVIHAET